MANTMTVQQLVQTEVPMSNRMSQIRVLLEQIEDMKQKILFVHQDQSLPFAIKQTKLEEMQQALLQTEHYTINLMQEHIASGGEIE